MKKLRVIAMVDCQEALFEELLHLGCVEISSPDDHLADPAWAALLKRGMPRMEQVRNEIADVNTALSAIKQYAKVKDGLFLQRRSISEEEFLSEKTVDRAREVSQKIGGLLQELAQLEGDEKRLLSQQAALQPWKSLDLPLEQEGTAQTVFRLGVCPGSTDTGAFRTELAAENLAAELYEVDADKQQKYYFIISHRSEEEKLQELLRPHNFSAVTFRGLAGTASENMRVLEQQLTKNRERQEKVKTEIQQSGDSRDMLRVYADRLNVEAAKDASAQRLLTDGTIFFFEGWLPVESEKEVKALLERNHCAWETEDPAPEEYASVPIKLKNNWLTRPLNMVTEMYSLPSYDNVDPNPLMAPFFILFYGIMMADMGYGLLMMIISLIVMKKYRLKGTAGHLFSLMGLCGVTTFIMGAITGGFFGDFIPQFAKLINPESTLELPALFTPLNDTLMILIGSMCLGLVQIVTGMAISFIEKLKRRRYIDAFSEEFTWWVIFAGIGCMAAGITNLVLIAGGVLLLAGCIVNGRGFVGRIFGIFGSLYNHITGYFGDILSYSRLMALMLAGSVIAQVFNTIGAIPGNIAVFILISLVGNTLNFGLNILGCYVHDLRLQ